MQILAIAGIFGAFALACFLIYVVGRWLHRRGRDLTFVDPAYPESLQGTTGNLGQLPVDRIGTHVSEQFIDTTEWPRTEKPPGR